MNHGERQSDDQVPPGGERPPHPWEDVPLAQWNDWRWQLSHRLQSVEDFVRIIRLTLEEVEGFSTAPRFPAAVTPYFASLMDADDPNCPIRRQVVPTLREAALSTADMVDSLGEDAHSPVPGLVHRYPDRVLMLVSTQCASICRFCTRNRIVGDAHVQIGGEARDRQLAYIAATPQVRDVLLSGGDPLVMASTHLESILDRLREIPHVEVLRIGTRAPIFLPQRITDDLIAVLRRHHPLWMNIHINHPREITLEAEAALARLADAGIPLGSQTVLLAGINDCPNLMRSLMQKLVRNRVRPYYVYQCDLVQGAAHFRTPVAKGVEIIEALRGHTSGFAVPTFVIDAPAGGGKVPVMPQYLLTTSDRQVVVRNYEGHISAYAQPTAYQSHDSSACHYCQSRLGEDDQEGVAGLLAGHALTIAPEGWSGVHRRHSGGEEARGNTMFEAPRKYAEPLGDGNGRGPA